MNPNEFYSSQICVTLPLGPEVWGSFATGNGKKNLVQRSIRTCGIQKWEVKTVKATQPYPNTGKNSQHDISVLKMESVKLFELFDELETRNWCCP